MLVYMIKDLEHVGMAGQTVKVKDGYAKNFLIPRGFAKALSSGEKVFLEKTNKNREVKKEAIASKIGMLSEKIKNMHISISKRAHDDGKLYGSIGADEIVEALKAKDISINKKQVDFEKTIKTVGEHTAIIKLSSKLQPELSVKVIEDKTSQ